MLGAIEVKIENEFGLMNWVLRLVSILVNYLTSELSVLNFVVKLATILFLYFKFNLTDK